MEFLSKSGLDYFWKQILGKLNGYVAKEDLNDYVAKEDGKGLSSEDYTSEEKTKLASLSTTAEENQNAFGIIKTKSGSINATVNADAKVDTVTFEAGDNITLITNEATGVIKIIGAEAPEAPEASLEALGISATAEELNRVAGVTSNIQTQLNAKVPTNRTINGKALSSNVSLTYSDVDAAPAGYGLGQLVNYSVSNDTEIDNTLTTVISEMGSHYFKRIVLSFTTTTNFTNAGGHYYADIYKLSTNYALITIKSYIQGGRIIQRIWFEGELKPWEWVNPPMNVDVEYRTIERIDNKAVYKKKNSSGQILYRLDGETEWKTQVSLIGAAPAGYGLGGKTSEPETDDLNSTTACGWYAFTSSTLNRPFDYGSVMVSNRYGNQVTQMAFNPRMGGYGEICIRHFYDGAWNEWEYINPPMKLDVEYRTIERINGKVVYKKKNSNGEILYRLDGETEWNVQASLMGAALATHTHNYVPTSRTINGKALSSNITLSASDVSARSNTWVPALTDCSGTLSIAKGGTDATTAKAAQYNLLKDMNTNEIAITDDSSIVFKYSTSASATNGAIFSKPVTTLKTYILGNTTSTELGYLSGVTSNIQTQLNKRLNLYATGTDINENDDLNDYTTPGVYTAVLATAQTLSNTPCQAGFKLIVMQGYNSNYISQFVFRGNANQWWYRSYSYVNAPIWTDWQSYLPTSGGTLTNNLTIDKEYAFLYLANGDGEKVGAFYGSPTEHKPYILSYPSDNSGYYEGYGLPAATTGLTAHKWYNILTTKNKVTAAQGGTGHDLSNIPANAVIRNSSDDTGLWYTATANGALYATAANGAIRFGTLPVAQGGTGGTTAKAAAYNLLNDMNDSTVALTDDSKFVFKLATTASTENGVLMAKSASLIWNYIKSKADSVYSTTDTKVTQTSTEDAAKNTNWYILCGPSKTTGARGALLTNDFRVQNFYGTTSEMGEVELILGNSINTGTAGNKQGFITLYSPGTSYHTIKGASITSACSHTLPNKSGTFHTTGSVLYSSTQPTGTYTGQLWLKPV